MTTKVPYDVEESPLVVANEVEVVQVLADKFKALLKKSDFKKKEQ